MFKQIGINLFFKILLQILPFIGSVFIARYSGAEVLGVLSLASSMVLMVDTFFNTGIGSANIFYLNKGVNHSQGNGAMIVVNYVIKFIFIIIIGCVSYFYFYKSQGNKEMFWVIIIFCFSSLINSFFQVSKSYFNAIVDQKRANLPTFWNILLSNITKSIAAFYYGSVIPIALVMLMSNLLTSPIAIIVFFKKTTFTIPELKLVKAYFKKGLSFLSFTLTKILPQHLDKIILGIMVGTYMVGVYTVAQRVGSALESIALAISMVLFPVFSKAVTDNKIKKIIRILHKFNVIFLLIILPFFLAISFNSSFILEFIFGREFGKGSVLMKIFIINALITICLMPLTNILIGFDCMKSANKFNLISFMSFLVIPIMLLLLPDMSENGKSLLVTIGRLLINIIAFVLYAVKASKLIELKTFKYDGFSILGIFLFYIIIILSENILLTEDNLGYIANLVSSIVFLFITWFFLNLRGYNSGEILSIIRKGK